MVGPLGGGTKEKPLSWEVSPGKGIKVASVGPRVSSCKWILIKAGLARVVVVNTFHFGTWEREKGNSPQVRGSMVYRAISRTAMATQ